MFAGPAGDDAVCVTGFVDMGPRPTPAFGRTFVVYHTEDEIEHRKGKYPVYKVWPDGADTEPLLGLAGGAGVQLIPIKTKVNGAVRVGCFASVQIAGAAEITVSREVAQSLQHGSMITPDLTVASPPFGASPVLGMALDRLAHKSKAGEIVARIVISPYSVRDLQDPNADDSKFRLPRDASTDSGAVTGDKLRDFLKDPNRGGNLFADLPDNTGTLTKAKIVETMKTNLPFLPWGTADDDVILRLIIGK